MAEILSREKELFKINHELNLMSFKPAEEATQMVTQSRYGTFLKQKGPSTLLKKKINMDAASKVPLGRAVKSKGCKSPNKNTADVKTPTTTTPSPQLTTPRGKVTPPLMSQLTKSKIPDWKQGNDWKPGKSANKYSICQPAHRVESSFTRRASHKTATYVKYRNPNFTQSPSLDLLLRNDDELQIQQQVVELEVMQQRESTTVVNGKSKKQLTQDNFIRFLKAKVAILEEDHGQLTQDMADQKQRLEQVTELLRQAEIDRDRLINSNTKLSDQLQRLEQLGEESNRRQKEYQQEQSNQQRELEILKRDAKMLKQANINLENRLIRSNDEAETARQMLSQQNSQQRDAQDVHRKELKVRDSRIKGLKRQRADLLNAYKKQLFMIDNLKRQNSCVEQSVAIGFGEKEFNKVLEWNSSSSTVF